MSLQLGTKVADLHKQRQSLRHTDKILGGFVSHAENGRPTAVWEHDGQREI